MADLLTASTLPASRGPVFRHSVLGAAVFTLVMFLMSLLPIGYREFADIFPEAGQIPRWLAYAFSALWGLMAMMGWMYWRRGMTKENWRVRLRQDGMWIHLRSHLNGGLPESDRVVLDLPFDEVERFRKTRERGSSPGTEAGTEQITFSTYLDLKVPPSVAEAVRQALVEERERLEKHRKKQWVARHFPVSVEAGEWLRIAWSGVRPGIKSLRNLLAGKVVEEPELKLRQAGWSTLSGPELEARILDLAGKGREIEAVSLIRQKYGYNITRAREFLSRLKNS